MARPLAAYIKDGRSFRVGGHAGGAAISGFETHLPPAGTLHAKLECLLFHQKPARETFILKERKLGDDYRQLSKPLGVTFQSTSEALKS